MDVKSTKVKSHRRALSVPSTVHKVARKKGQVIEEAKNKSRGQFEDDSNAPSTSRGHVRIDVDRIEVIEDYDDFSVSSGEAEMINIQEMEPPPGDHPRYRRHRHFWQLDWRRVHFSTLPSWLQDNEFLHSGHRPPMPSFGSCFKSIFSLHTETGNIFTHMYGCIAFIGIACWFLSQSNQVISWTDKFYFSTFFVGAILCMGMSFAFHTVQCHSESVQKVFSKLDYAGISLLIVGSFVPWIYYGFYCRTLPKCLYITMIVVLGISAFIVSLWDKFAEPAYRHWRAIVFLSMGLSSIAPTMHLAITDGILWMIEKASFHWLVLMGILYITGALIYAFRIPERFFPGKFDIWFQSHQIFHLFVVAAALVHFYGLMLLARHVLEDGSCSEIHSSSFASAIDDPPIYWLDENFRPF